MRRAAGYCPHFNTLFPTWHRAELASIERAMRNRAREIAIANNRTSATVAEGARWLKAAEELAFPYFNWASPSLRTLPSYFLASTTQLSVLAPNSRTITVRNPLAVYNIPR